MSRIQKKFHFIYKTTCVINNKFYVGMHSTNDLNDGYLGSGKRLSYSIGKYGRENHKREILEYLPNTTFLKEREENIVNEKFIENPLCMNLMVGGKGGKISDEQQMKRAKAAAASLHLKRKNNLEYAKNINNKISNSIKDTYRLGKRQPILPNWNGRKHSEESKEKMREVYRSGVKNSQFGTCWITNEIENKKICKGDLIPEGWKLGRKIKI